MKVQSKIAEGFRPIQITFTIETDEELQSLKRLFRSDLSVPEFVTGSNISDESKLMSKLMGDLYIALDDF